MERRKFIFGTLASGLVIGGLLPLNSIANKQKPSIQSMQSDWRKLLPASAKFSQDAKPLKRPAAEWQKELPKNSYRVLFKEDTEHAFSSPLNDEKRPGIFVCRACDLPLFSSEMKYDSGTGWPSFFTSIPDHLATKTDYKLIWPRTEYHCVKCGGHQGHLFDDGPAPTSQRWCNNGVALRFIPS
jgi:peptide-methionine (R)-S-oxide reductase